MKKIDETNEMIEIVTEMLSKGTKRHRAVLGCK